LPAFNTQSLDGIRVCTGSTSNCYDYLFDNQANPFLQSRPTALALFSHSYIRCTDINQPTMEQIFEHTDCGNSQCSQNGCAMQRPGFNTECYNNWARFGYCDNSPHRRSNIEGQCQAADSNVTDRTIGLGLQGSSYLQGSSASYKSAGVAGYPGQSSYGLSLQMWLFGIVNQ
jgi:hypothetical protein